MHRLARRFSLAISLTLIFAFRANGTAAGHFEPEKVAAPPAPAAPLMRVVASGHAPASLDLSRSTPKKYARHHVSCRPLGFGCLQNI